MTFCDGENRMIESRRQWALIAAAALAVGACSDETPMMEPEPLTAPTGVTANATGPWAIDVTWNAVTGATSYRVERQRSGGAFQVVGEVSATTFADAALNPATVYGYRVTALAGSQSSPASGTITISTVGEELVGNISAQRTLDAGTIYVLRGVVQVQDGGELVIPAGTLILGDQASQGTLLVLRGGRIVADGTVDNPIVFTSGLPPGRRAKGDWGGVVMNGRSNCNFPAQDCLGEGNTGAYGGNDPNDDSGILRYVVIQWAGIEFSPDNELNGLTLNGVGAGTTIEYVQSHGGRDDGIEFFGGTVDLRYAIVTDASDDSFDWSTGWQGRGQFWIVQQDPNDGDNGFEIDNNEQNFEALPRTFGRIFNFTMVGRAAANPGSNTSDNAIVFRRGYAGEHACGIIVGFGEEGIDIDDAATIRLANNDSLTLHNTILFDNGRDLAGFASPGFSFAGDDDGVNPDIEADWASRQTSLTQADPMLADAYNRDTPNFAPMAGSPALAANGATCTPPNDGWFDTSADYYGAVADANDTWYLGWTEFPKN